MKKSTLFALVILAASSTVIGRVLFGATVDPSDGWDYAVLLASFGFLLSLGQLVSICYRNWFEIGPTINCYAAWTGIVFSVFAFGLSLVHFFAPEYGIFSDAVQNILMIIAVFILFLSVSSFREWPRTDARTSR